MLHLKHKISDKRKPVERQGRKVKGLQLPKRNQDRQTAEDRNERSFAGLVYSRPAFVGTLQKKAVPIKRKPVERQGRKAMDLKPRKRP